MEWEIREMLKQWKATQESIRILMERTDLLFRLLQVEAMQNTDRWPREVAVELANAKIPASRGGKPHLPPL